MSIDNVIVDDLGHQHGLINKQVNHKLSGKWSPTLIERHCHFSLEIHNYRIFIFDYQSDLNCYPSLSSRPLYQ